ncbi:hypothetical protein [Tenacibaculum finnmarkense]|uniref:hypothetical protein n=1 Tax=Tenacibaculum finnmarkense TaxID=2781243 RepID=UPI00207AF230|nr:hypothetical protein [Tenacibaculum finnmarkense]MCM8905569.1 hypothetical protein [Tenacibaculum finnmarkense genomovar finnmarkense]MCM8905582.1 hypothetical protein [Tenacibaculum finnmarkense genomovar finnmarkense]
MLRYELSSSRRRPQAPFSSVTGGAYDYVSAVDSATSFVSKGDFETSDFLNLVAPAANALIPGGGQVVNIVSGLFAKDDWETEVKPAFEAKAKVILEYMVETYLKNPSLSELERVNLFDAYASAALFHQYKHIGSYKHSNSRNATQLGADIMQAFLDGFRADFAVRYDVVDVTSDVRGWGFKSYNGAPFSFRYGSLIPHKVYSIKDLGADASKKDAIVPFSPSGGGSSDAVDEGGSIKEYWWLLFIPVVLYAVYKGFQLSNNKNKKRR